MSCSCTEPIRSPDHTARPDLSYDPIKNTVGEGVRFQRIRRITGYLVGTTDRFNNAKRAEERDRVKHSV